MNLALVVAGWTDAPSSHSNGLRCMRVIYMKAQHACPRLLWLKIPHSSPPPPEGPAPFSSKPSSILDPLTPRRPAAVAHMHTHDVWHCEFLIPQT